MNPKKTPTKGQAQPCPEMIENSVRIPRSEVARIHDRLMTGTALVLAMHRQAQAEREGNCATPAELILWQGFIAVLDAAEALGQAAGYRPEESRPE